MENKILDLAKKVLAETEVHGVLESAMDHLVGLSSAERGMIILFNPEGMEVFETARNLNKEDIKNPEFEVSRTIIDEVKLSGIPRCFPNAFDDPNLQESESTLRLKILSVICLPLKHQENIFGAIYLDNRTVRGMFTPQMCELVKSFSDFISLAAYNALEKTQQDQHIALLESELRGKFQFNSIISHCPQMIKILKVVSQIANSDVTVLIQGESGTGKELIAHSIHFNSNRKHNPFIPINCGALPENLLESELFGYVKGAFTGANSDKAGWFETANGGTLFLDEVSEMTPALQVKFLRVLQTSEFSKVGSREIKKIDVRIIAATNQKINDLIKEGKFRQDLFYRLNVVEIDLPALRNRKFDILILAKHFIKKYCAKYNKNQIRLSRDAAACLLAYHYPGNVRELENAIQRAVTLDEDNIISIQELPDNFRSGSTTVNGKKKFSSLTETKRQAADQAEHEFVTDCLQAISGHVREAAKMAGVDASNFHKIMRKHKIDFTIFKS